MPPGVRFSWPVTGVFAVAMPLPIKSGQHVWQQIFNYHVYHLFTVLLIAWMRQTRHSMPLFFCFTSQIKIFVLNNLQHPA